MERVVDKTEKDVWCNYSSSLDQIYAIYATKLPVTEI